MAAHTQYICKGKETTGCMKIINDDNIEMSIGFDDNCGRYKDKYARGGIAFFKGDDTKPLSDYPPLLNNLHDFEKENDCREIACWNEPELFLKVLAEHLGYEVRKKEEIKCPEGHIGEDFLARLECGLCPSESYNKCKDIHVKADHVTEEDLPSCEKCDHSCDARTHEECEDMCAQSREVS